MGETQTQTWVRRGSSTKLDPEAGGGGGAMAMAAAAQMQARAAAKSMSLNGNGSFLNGFFLPATTSTAMAAAAAGAAAAAAATGGGSGGGTSLTTVLIILSWYFSNIGVLLLNKYLLSFYGYRYPIFLTMLHMCACSAYSYIAIAWLAIVPMQFIMSRRQLLKIAALSAIFSFSVVCGNTSLRYLPVSFNQAIGATTPFFTAIFAVLITCKREASMVYMALLPVVFGIVVASRSEPMFHLLGFLICVASTGGRALKSVVQGILLTSDAEKIHSMNLLLYMAPISALLLLPFTLAWEGNVLAITIAKAQQHPAILLLLLANMTVAYLVNLTNFLVTKHTSALTLQVLGNAKAAVAAIVSVLIFRNPVTVMGMTGFIITIFGVVLYSEAKKRFRAPH